MSAESIDQANASPNGRCTAVNIESVWWYPRTRCMKPARASGFCTVHERLMRQGRAIEEADWETYAEPERCGL